MVSDKDLFKAFDDFNTKLDKSKIVTGTMGKLVSATGNRVFDVDGRAGYSWVTLDNGTVIAAINSGIGSMPKQKLAVQVLYTPTGPKVWGLDHTKADNNLGSSMPDIGAGPHSHGFGTGLEYIVNALQYEPFLTYHRPLDPALTLYISPIFYSVNGVDSYFPGKTIDISTITGLPLAAGNWVWIRVGINATTGQPVTVMGTPQPATNPLTADQISAIAFPYLSSAAFRFRGNQTSFTNYEKDFVDCRYWLSATAGSGSIGNYQTIDHNGTPVAQRPAFNFIDGTNVSLTVADNAGQNRTDITVSSSNSYQTVDHNGSALTQRPAINFIDGSNVTLTIADNSGQNRTDVTIAAASGSSGNLLIWPWVLG